ncbi:unnamed protein product [Sphagnum jensenii]|uniref:Protein XRI1 n=1 Tax=Sphagnum jensenii TaxID=128206 RepID=A0ABP0X2H7_9BRYO
MAGRGGDTTEPWYWRDDLFKLDFKESPLVVSAATSRSFWDDLTQSEGDFHALFASSPVTDSRYCNPSLFSFDIQGKGIDSQGSPSSDYGIQQNQRYKRRRMLQFSGARTDTLPPDSATPVLASGLGDCINLSIPGSENNILPFPTSPSFLWCTRNEDASGPAIANVQQWGEKWMVRCFEQNRYNACYPMETINFHKAAPLPDISEMILSGLPFDEFHPGDCPQPWQPQPQHQQEADMLQGPATPFSKPPLFGQKPSTGSSRFKLKSQTPVTYPFALLKPYSAEGAVTLNDINKRLLSLPPRPVQGTIPINERPLAQLGSGLSGKSVVACTKIHTEGNGTITIMRTKG